MCSCAASLRSHPTLNSVYMRECLCGHAHTRAPESGVSKGGGGECLCRHLMLGLLKHQFWAQDLPGGEVVKSLQRVRQATWTGSLICVEVL